MSAKRKPRLGEMLVNEKVVTEDQLQKALEKQGRKKRRLGKVLIDMGATNEVEIAGAISRQLDMPYVDLDSVTPSPAAAGLLQKSFLSNNLLIPLEIDNGELTVAIADPNNLMALDEASHQTGLKVRPVISTETGVLKCIERALHINEHIEEMLKAFKVREDVCFLALPHDKEGDVHRRFRLEGSSQAVRMLAFIITDAFTRKASEILIEPGADRLRLRYRILGDLVDITSLPGLLRDSLVSHLKIVSNLDLADKKTMQTGRCRFSLANRSVLVEVSTMPTPLGERVSLALYDRERPALSFKEMGLDPDTSKRLLGLASEGQGLVLFAGPKGCGKNTAMYAMLREISSDRLDIVTIQEHASCRLDRATQIELGELSAAETLRYSTLNRPDVIMIDRVADSQTASLALSAAAEGALVLAGVVASGPAEAVSRLVTLGLEPGELAAALAGTVGMRLIRNICPGCREAYVPNTRPLAGLGLDMPRTFYRGRGCKDCNKTGYKGYTPVVETMKLEGGDARVIGSASIGELREFFNRGPVKTQFDTVWSMIQSGKTTVEELVVKLPPAYWKISGAKEEKARPAAGTAVSAPPPAAAAPQGRGAAYAPSAAEQLLPHADAFRETMRQYKVLLAVSDSGDLDIIKGLIEDADMQPVVALDGKHALDLMYSEGPDLLICDLRIPDMEHLSSYKRVYDTQRKHLPVITISRGSIERFTELDKQLDVDIKLLRPINPKHFMDKVTLLLADSQ